MLCRRLIRDRSRRYLDLMTTPTMATSGNPKAMAEKFNNLVLEFIVRGYEQAGVSRVDSFGPWFALFCRVIRYMLYKTNRHGEKVLRNYVIFAYSYWRTWIQNNTYPLGRRFRPVTDLTLFSDIGDIGARVYATFFVNPTVEGCVDEPFIHLDLLDTKDNLIYNKTTVPPPKDARLVCAVTPHRPATQEKRCSNMAKWRPLKPRRPTGPPPGGPSGGMADRELFAVLDAYSAQLQEIIELSELEAQFEHLVVPTGRGEAEPERRVAVALPSGLGGRRRHPRSLKEFLEY